MTTSDVATGRPYAGAIDQPGTYGLLIAIFLCAYLLPGNIQVGTLTLGFPRLILTLLMIPALLIVALNPAYKKTWVDACVVGYAAWVAISVLKNNGFARIEFAGLQVVETLGAYTLGRIMVATPQGYRLFWRTFGYCLLFILPIGLFELFTERFLLHEVFDPLINTFGHATEGYDRRLGFDRVQGNFEHPILFGVFWGFGLIHFLSVYDSRAVRLFMMGACLLAVGISLSSGAYLAVMIQIALLIWGMVSRDRWGLLVILFALLYIVVEILSDRPALLAIATRLAFSADTAYWRALIFEFGIQNVWANPIFGLGLRDWVRPAWLAPSVDNQWLLAAMRGGLPAFFLQMGAFAVMIYMLLSRKDLSPRMQMYRRNYLISFIGLFLALGTVAVWSGTQAFLWVVLAMGTGLATMADPDAGSGDPGPSEPEAAPGARVANSYARAPLRAAHQPGAAALPYARSPEMLRETAPYSKTGRFGKP